MEPLECRWIRHRALATAEIMNSAFVSVSLLFISRLLSAPVANVQTNDEHDFLLPHAHIHTRTYLLTCFRSSFVHPSNEPVLVFLCATYAALVFGTTNFERSIVDNETLIQVERRSHV